jgi:hypothetical protein
LSAASAASAATIPRRAEPAARLGGFALIAASVLFMAVFGYLASTFDYPDVLDRPAAEVLPRLTALGAAGRAVWSLYALVPLLLVPAGVGVVAALGRSAPGAARAAQAFATVAALSMMLGLLRWPSIHWELGRAWASASEPERAAIAPVFAGLNSYLGNFIGEFVGELCLGLFFALTAWAMWRDEGYPRWAGIAGLVASGLGFVAMFRNVTTAVEPFAMVINAVLPLWLIVLGVCLVRGRAMP